jgi:hypothetical protein
LRIIVKAWPPERKTGGRVSLKDENIIGKSCFIPSRSFHGLESKQNSIKALLSGRLPQNSWEKPVKEPSYGREKA